MGYNGNVVKHVTTLTDSVVSERKQIAIDHRYKLYCRCSLCLFSITESKSKIILLPKAAMIRLYIDMEMVVCTLDFLLLFASFLSLSP